MLLAQYVESSLLPSLMLMPLVIFKSMASSVKSASDVPNSAHSSIECTTNRTICGVSHFNQVCNLTSGKCECPPSSPLYLAAHLPCLSRRRLGEICMHSRECSLVSNSVCIASILFPIELLTIPNYRQWYIYNQITQSSELHFILNKVYGRCRCRAGYRANKHRHCSPLSRETPVSCDQPGDCASQHHLNHSLCNLAKHRCDCDSQFYYDPLLQQCQRIVIQFGQFCVTSSDCQVNQTQLECHNERCTCPPDHTYHLGRGCQLECDPRTLRSDASKRCLPPTHDSLTFTALHSLLLKILLILLIKLFICNLIRFACYASARHNADNDEDEEMQHRRRSRTSLAGGRNERARSLISLPPYEAIMSDEYYQIQLEERLPSYNEVVMDERSKADANCLSTDDQVNACLV